MLEISGKSRHFSGGKFGGKMKRKFLGISTLKPEEGSVPGSLRGYDAVRHGRRGRGGVL